MTNKQIKVLEELLQDEGFKGKKMLRHVLWMNTVKPKFKIGDCFLVSDPGHRLFGYPVRDFKAKIVEIKCWNNQEEWCYEFEMEVECNGKTITSGAFKSESELLRAKKCDGNKTVLGEAKSEHTDSIEVTL